MDVSDRRSRVLGQFFVRVLNYWGVWEWVRGIVLDSYDNYSIIMIIMDIQLGYILMRVICSVLSIY